MLFHNIISTFIQQHNHLSNKKMCSMHKHLFTCSGLENVFCFTNHYSDLRPLAQEEKLHRKLQCGRLFSQANPKLAALSLSTCHSWLHLLLSTLPRPPLLPTLSATCSLSPDSVTIQHHHESLLVTSHV